MSELDTFKCGHPRSRGNTYCAWTNPRCRQCHLARVRPHSSKPGKRTTTSKQYEPAKYDPDQRRKWYLAWKRKKGKTKTYKPRHTTSNVVR